MGERIIKEGDAAPEFDLASTEGGTISLKQFEGKQAVVLYFYPKDDTPGCTTEACDFRDNLATFKKKSVAVLGVSPDSVSSHEKFRKKFSLPFPLLADEDHKVCEAYGVWQKKKFMGKEYMGVVRSTFVIDKTGTITRALRDIKAAGHVEDLLVGLA